MVSLSVSLSHTHTHTQTPYLPFLHIHFYVSVNSSLPKKPCTDCLLLWQFQSSLTVLISKVFYFMPVYWKSILWQIYVLLKVHGVTETHRPTRIIGMSMWTVDKMGGPGGRQSKGIYHLKGKDMRLLKKMQVELRRKCLNTCILSSLCAKKLKNCTEN